MCSGRRVAAHFCFHAPEKQSSTQEPPWWMDGWIFTTNRAVLNGGQGERVKPWKFLSAECLVFITRFSRKKTLFPSLYGLLYPVKERERERKRIRLRFHVQPWNNPRSRHTLIYIYVYIYYIYIYTFPSLFVAVPRRKENYLGIGTFKTFRTFSYNFVNAVYG